MTPAERIVAMIPARGGSKGIPGKNIVQLAGKPLIAYTVEQAVASARVGRVIVSTDSEEIAAAAEQYGASVVFRPAEISGDEATSESALKHCLDRLESREAFVPELVVFLQATSPLRTTGDIDAAIATLERDEADSLFSACPQGAFVWRHMPTGFEPLSYDPRSRPRRQEAPIDVAENGSIYVFKPWVLKELGCRIGGRISVYMMSVLDSLQVDEIDDLPIVDIVLRARHGDQVR